MAQKEMSMINELKLQIDTLELAKQKNHSAIHQFHNELDEKPDGECPIIEAEIERLWFKQDTYNESIKECEAKIAEAKDLMKW